MYAVLISLAVCAAPAPKAGTYVLTGGHGSLVLGQGHFAIEVLGANAHQCQLDGAWAGQTGTVADATLPCVVKLVPAADGVEVSAVDAGQCASYCGARAWFEGRYLTPPAGCGAAEVKQARARFTAQYQRKRFSEAVATLTPVIERCQKVLDRFESAWVRNDLALAQHHAGDDAACLRTLEPLSDYRDVPMEEVGGAEPSFTELHQKLARATRTNARLCGYAPKP